VPLALLEINLVAIALAAFPLAPDGHSARHYEDPPD
jgi:hypothetical protein